MVHLLAILNLLTIFVVCGLIDSFCCWCEMPSISHGNSYGSPRVKCYCFKGWQSTFKLNVNYNLPISLVPAVALWVCFGLGEGDPVCRFPVCRSDCSSGGVLLQWVCWCLFWEDPEGEQTECLGPQHPARSVFINQSNQATLQLVLNSKAAILTWVIHVCYLCNATYDVVVVRLEKGHIIMFLKQTPMYSFLCFLHKETQLGSLPPIYFC